MAGGRSGDNKEGITTGKEEVLPHRQAVPRGVLIPPPAVIIIAVVGVGVVVIAAVDMAGIVMRRLRRMPLEVRR